MILGILIMISGIILAGFVCFTSRYPTKYSVKGNWANVLLIVSTVIVLVGFWF